MKIALYISLSIMISLVVASAILSLKENYIKIKINRINKDININYDQLQSLKAQWGYVNNKAYLQFLTKKYLPNFVPTNIKPNK